MLKLPGKPDSYLLFGGCGNFAAMVQILRCRSEWRSQHLAQRNTDAIKRLSASYISQPAFSSGFAEFRLLSFVLAESFVMIDIRQCTQYVRDKHHQH